jgi:hypothetical protein
MELTFWTLQRRLHYQFQYNASTIELTLDELLEAEEQMAAAYSQAHTEDMRGGGIDDVDMPYSEYSTAEGNGNDNFLLDMFATSCCLFI